VLRVSVILVCLLHEVPRVWFQNMYSLVSWSMGSAGDVGTLSEMPKAIHTHSSLSYLTAWQRIHSRDLHFEDHTLNHFPPTHPARLMHLLRFRAGPKQLALYPSQQQ